MGNTPSIHASRRRRSKGNQKLSKPHIGNPTAAGLLNSNGIVDKIRRPSSTSRCVSLPTSPASNIFPHQLEIESAGEDDRTTSYEPPSPAEDFSSRSPVKSESQEGLSLEGQSARALFMLSRDRRMSRASPVYMGISEGLEQGQLGSTTSERNASLSSMNHELSFYETRRMSNLIEEPSFENQPITSDEVFQASLPRRQSFNTPYQPAYSDAGTLLPRTSSDAALYTPMRRKSLMVPGVARRPAPAEPIPPPEIPARHGLSPASSHYPFPETGKTGFLSPANLSSDPSSIPRAQTPCETDYQTGAFKHGTLRIVNGSPTRTLARESSDTCIRTGSPVLNKQRGVSDSSQYPNPLDVEQGAAVRLLPELSLSMTPLSIGAVEATSSELEITSKNTALEDELFEDSSPEYGSEILNVRLDHDAKRSLSSPRSPEERNRTDFSRSDSGIVASPSPNNPPKLLAKADSGYSSNASVRSFSSRRNGRQEADCSRYTGSTLPQDHALNSSNLPVKTLSSADHLDSDFNSSPTPASALTISTARTPGRLQRLLSGSRAPLAVHVTHVHGTEASVPPIPRAIQAKLNEHVGLSYDIPNGPHDNTSKTDGSYKPTVTTETATTSGYDIKSRDAIGDGQKTVRNQARSRSFRSSLKIPSFGSTITRAASSVLAKKNILKRLTPNKSTLEEQDATDSAPGTYTSDYTYWQSANTRNRDATLRSPMSGRNQHSGPIGATSRSNSASISVRGTDADLALPGKKLVSKTPPLVSMKTRTTGTLQAAPPIRSRSTPPMQSGTPTLLHKSSREVTQSYPAYNQHMHSDSTSSSRRSSQESYYTYSTAQMQALLNQQNQLSSVNARNRSSIQSHPAEYRSPGGIPNSYYGVTAGSSQAPSVDYSRHSSLASQTSQGSALSNQQPWSHSAYDNANLRHHSSYDGSSLQPWQGYGHTNGSQPTLSRTQLRQSLQHQQQPRHTPRGHYRQQSLDQYGRPAPYRVLHSYNSPAYRGVPIWST